MIWKFVYIRVPGPLGDDPRDRRSVTDSALRLDEAVGTAGAFRPNHEHSSKLSIPGDHSNWPVQNKPGEAYEGVLGHSN